MRLLKKFEESVSNKFMATKGDSLRYQLLTIEEGHDTLESFDEDYAQYVRGILTGKSVVDYPHELLKALFVHSVDDKFRGSSPRAYLHGVYFRHVDPFASMVVGTYEIDMVLRKQWGSEAIIEDIYRTVHSIRKPTLNVIDETMFVWLNKMLFLFSSRMIKLEFTYSEGKVSATIRYTLPGESNQDIISLCRRDTRLTDCNEDIFPNGDKINHIKNYLRANGFLNINQVISNQKILTDKAVISRIAEMKITGYPTYATLQNGVASLGNLFNDKGNTVGLTPIEQNIILEAMEYVPWVQL